MKTVKQSPAAAPAAETKPELAQPIRFAVNIIVDGRDPYADRFIAAGRPSPFRSIDEVPESLRGFVVASDDSLPEESEERFANYELNAVYSMHSDGSRGRMIRRQFAELSSARAEQEWAEAEPAAQGKLDPETEAILQEQHDAHVAIQTKQLEIAARDRDMAPELIMQQQEEETAGQEPELEPRGLKRKGKQK